MAPAATAVLDACSPRASSRRARSGRRARRSRSSARAAGAGFLSVRSAAARAGAACARRARWSTASWRRGLAVDPDSHAIVAGLDRDRGRVGSDDEIEAVTADDQLGGKHLIHRGRRRTVRDADRDSLAGWHPDCDQQPRPERPSVNQLWRIRRDPDVSIAPDRAPLPCRVKERPARWMRSRVSPGSSLAVTALVSG